MKIILLHLNNHKNVLKYYHDYLQNFKMVLSCW